MTFSLALYIAWLFTSPLNHHRVRTLYTESKSHLGSHYLCIVDYRFKVSMENYKAAIDVPGARRVMQKQFSRCPHEPAEGTLPRKKSISACTPVTSSTVIPP